MEGGFYLQSRLVEVEEERSLIKDLKRHARLAVAWSPHGSPERVKAKEHRPYGILGGCVVGCPLSRRGKLDRWRKVIIGFPVSIPSALVNR